MPIYTVLTADDGRITSTAIMSENHRVLTEVHRNHWEVTEDQYRQVTDGGRWTYLGGVIVPGWPTEEELDQLKRVAKIPLDVHLMITDPDRYIEAFAAAVVTREA